MMKQSIIFLSIILLLTQCKKSIVDGVKPSNIYTLHADYTQNGLYVFSTSDDGIILVSNSSKSLRDSIFNLVFTKFDMNENIIWQKEIPNLGKLFSFNRCKDGGLIILSSQPDNRLIRVNSECEVVFNKPFNTNQFRGYLNPIENSDGTYTVTESKMAVWIYDHSNIFVFDSKGDLINSIQRKYTEGHLNGGLDYSYVFNQKSPDSVQVLGAYYMPNTSWLDNARIFVAQFNYSGNSLKSKKIVCLDSSNVNNFNYSGSLEYIYTPNKELIIMVSRTEPSKKEYTHLIKLNENYQIIWEKDLMIGNTLTYANSINLTKDGNYLITGFCNTIDRSINQPFVAKVKSDGSMLWNKVYPMPQNCIMNYGIEHSNGNLFITGSTNSFGSGMDGSDAILLKLAGNGKWE